MDELTNKVNLLLDKTTDPKIKLRYKAFLDQNKQPESSEESWECRVEAMPAGFGRELTNAIRKMRKREQRLATIKWAVLAILLVLLGCVIGYVIH